jgi:hypothetical protein
MEYDYSTPSDELFEVVGDVTPLGTPIVAMSFDDAKALWTAIAPTARYFRKVQGRWVEIPASTYRLLMDFLPDAGGRGTFLRID